MHARIWKDQYHGGYFFKYWHPIDREWTEDGPFKTFDEAEEALVKEQEDLFVECEGCEVSPGLFEVGREQ
jgi:hypothetical protein